MHYRIPLVDTIVNCNIAQGVPPTPQARFVPWSGRPASPSHLGAFPSPFRRGAESDETPLSCAANAPQTCRWRKKPAPPPQTAHKNSCNSDSVVPELRLSSRLWGLYFRPVSARSARAPMLQSTGALV